MDQQTLIIIVVAVIVILFLLNRKNEETEHYRCITGNTHRSFIDTVDSYNSNCIPPTNNPNSNNYKITLNTIALPLSSSVNNFWIMNGKPISADKIKGTEEIVICNTADNIMKLVATPIRVPSNIYTSGGSYKLNLIWGVGAYINKSELINPLPNSNGVWAIKRSYRINIYYNRKNDKSVTVYASVQDTLMNTPVMQMPFTNIHNFYIGNGKGRTFINTKYCAGSIETYS